LKKEKEKKGITVEEIERKKDPIKNTLNPTRKKKSDNPLIANPKRLNNPTFLPLRIESTTPGRHHH
jgi:hypothetical protein